MLIDENNAVEAPTLPTGWALSTLGEIAELIGGGTPSREIPEYFGGDIVWLTPTEIPKSKVAVVLDSKERLTDAGLRKSSARLIPKGAVLLTSRASIGFVAIAGTEVTTNQGFASFVCNEGVHNLYLAYWLWASRGILVQNATGTTFKEITKSKLRPLTFPIAPLPEQIRIVAKIDELFTRLDAGVATLKRVQTALKRYKAAVLKAACEGRLVPQDPNDEPASKLLERMLAERRTKATDSKMRENEATASTGINEPRQLPNGWVWAKIGQVGFVQLGRQRAPKHHTGIHMRPYLRVANVFENRIDTNDVLEMNFTPKEYETFLLKYGDILLNEGQSPELLGRPAMFRDEVQGACFQNTLIRFRAYEGLNRSFALHTFLYYLHAEKFRRRATQTTNMAHLSSGRFANMEFALPPLAEQVRIVTEVERQLSVVEELQTTIATNLVRAERLRQSILKRAFEGKLVPQDSSDEPVADLVERIKTMRRQSAKAITVE
jgi:type I restriction enzyme, S subunit